MELISKHIVSNLKPSTTLYVALQGPQGSGKSYLSARLKSYLSSPPHSLSVALLSIDDLYLPHNGLVALAAAYPQNILWHGRGLPGTHDVELGVRVLGALGGRERAGEGIELPRFEKSLYDGEGDRLPMGLQNATVVKPPVDVVILEGWCVGFCPIPQKDLDQRWDGIWAEERQKLLLGDKVKKVDIEVINEKLEEYLKLWRLFDLFIQIKPTPANNNALLPSQYSIIYKWRLEQEHNMKASNGGRGMSDEAVKAFVDRYIPGYIFFGTIPPSPVNHGRRPEWAGEGLRVLIDETRRVVGVERF